MFIGNHNNDYEAPKVTCKTKLNNVQYSSDTVSCTHYMYPVHMTQYHVHTQRHMSL